MSEPGGENPQRPEEGGNTELPVESNDDAVLKMLSGAQFGPNAKIVLPSGKQLSGDEAQAFTSAFSDDRTESASDRVPDEEDTHPSSPDNRPHYPQDMMTGFGDPAEDSRRLVARAKQALAESAASQRGVAPVEKTQQPATERAVTQQRLSGVRNALKSIIPRKNS